MVNRQISSHSKWDELPSVAMKKIFGLLKVGDRARSKMVSKAWKHILARGDLTTAPEQPWQFLPELSRFDPDSYMTRIQFVSLSEGNKKYSFQLPKFNENDNVIGGWFCGSSSGWLVIASGPKFNPNMFLWNPLNGVVVKLPALSTLSFLPQLLKSGPQVYNISTYIKRAHVFSQQCIVALIFSDPDGDKKSDYLALCAPKDEKWTVLEGGYFYSFSDTLFHDRKLYVLARTKDKFDDVANKDDRTKVVHTVCLSGCQVEVCVLCLDYKVVDARGTTKFRYIRNPLFNITYNNKICEHLVDFSGQLLVIGVMYDLFEYNSCNDDGPLKPFQYHQMHSIEVRKVDGQEKVETDFLKGHVVMLADTSSFVVPSDVDEPGVQFTTSYVRERIGADKDQCVVREHGFFSLQSDQMVSYDVEHLQHHPVQYRTGWLIPKLN